MAKKLKRITLFLAGEPDVGFPDKATVSYVVKSGKAEKKAQLYEIVDLDPDLPVQQIFDEALAEIKSLEGTS